jgi:acyl-coenzyme A synthetase/AMP-(fatty) acid ligase
VLNPGGVRIGTAEIYRQVEKLEGIVESIVIGQDWDDDVRVERLRRSMRNWPRQCESRFARTPRLAMCQQRLSKSRKFLER